MPSYLDQMYRNSLSHHGILGQKWGVRRYQNEDGTLTALGRKRRGYNDAEIIKKAADYTKRQAEQHYAEGMRQQKLYDDAKKEYDYGKTKEGLARLRKDFKIPKYIPDSQLKDEYKDIFEGEKYYGGVYKDNIAKQTRLATQWTNHYLKLSNTKMKDFTDKDFDQAIFMTKSLLNQFDDPSYYNFSQKDYLIYKKG